MKQLSLLGGAGVADGGADADDEVGPAPSDESLSELAAKIPANVRLGTSTWSFPGWAGIVYDRIVKSAALARPRAGLAAYAQHPLFRTVGVDRSFYAPIPEVELRDFAASVPDDFRFLMKAPAAVTDAAERDAKGAPIGIRDTFLDPTLAVDSFIGPVSAALGDKLGPIVFQFSPLASFAAPERVIDSVQGFLRALPEGPLYAVEVRDPELIGRRFLQALASVGARYVISVHARMPPASMQLRFASALPPGPTVARWNLLAGHSYESAKASFAPFNRIRVPDETTRAALADAIGMAVRARQPAFVIANNKAEGSAPLTLRALAQLVVRSMPSG